MDHRFKTLFARISNRTKVGILLPILLVLGLLMADVTSVTTPSASAEDVPTTSVEQISTTNATAQQAATRVEAPKPLVFTRAQVRYLSILHVNGITYIHGKAAPAWEAFKIVARERGAQCQEAKRKNPATKCAVWNETAINSWKTAVIDIMMGESGFCPNVLRGARIANPQGCVLSRQGRYEDSGFGQLIGLNYRISKTNPAAGWLCRQEGLCSKWAIIASPWNSMTALVALIERSGTHPWCYNSWARRYHRNACNNPGVDV